VGHACQHCAPIYSSVHVTDEHMGPVKVKMDDPYIHRCRTQINEYNFIFVGPTNVKKTDE
jgi:hypothetical protein